MSNMQTCLVVQNEIDLLLAREVKYRNQLEQMKRNGSEKSALDSMNRFISTTVHTREGLEKYLEEIKGPAVPREYGGRLIPRSATASREQPLLVVLGSMVLGAAVVIGFLKTIV
jgi:hypothetical protein